MTNEYENNHNPGGDPFRGAKDASAAFSRVATGITSIAAAVTNTVSSWKAKPPGGPQGDFMP